MGDIVLAWDEATGQLVERKVTAVLPHPDDEIAVLTLDNGVVIATPDHPFFTIDAGWVPSRTPRPGHPHQDGIRHGHRRVGAD